VAVNILRYRALQLSACGIDVSASRPAHKRRDSCLDQQIFKCLYALLGRSGELYAGAGVQRDEIHLAADAA
jgi:hypothetical protein